MSSKPPTQTYFWIGAEHGKAIIILAGILIFAIILFGIVLLLTTK